MDSQIKSAIITLLGVAITFVITRYWILKDRNTDIAKLISTGIIQDGTAFRQDLLKDVEYLRARVNEMMDERIKRQSRYEELHDEHEDLKEKYEILKQNQRIWDEEKAELTRKVARLEDIIADLTIKVKRCEDLQSTMTGT